MAAKARARRAKDASTWCGQTVAPGERKRISLVVSESYSGADIRIPMMVWRGAAPGPTVAVLAAVHGDEINGTGAIRQLIMAPPFELLAGTLVLVPVVNLFGFERYSRYLPDRRDLNRCFPGSSHGSLASRLARALFDELIGRCDFAIDLHTAAVRRTNFPNVRADMTDPKRAAFARAFGADLLLTGEGPKGSLRRAAAAVGCHTLILEAGEVWKVEASAVEYAIRGISNCLAHLGMVPGTPVEPPYRIETDETRWIRANSGGFLSFHVGPGDVVERGQRIATNTSLTGEELNAIVAPRRCIVIGMTTLPSVAPGDPVCHLAFARPGQLTNVARVVASLGDDSLHERAREALGSSMLVTDA
mgnify:CR=1 FL=1